MAAAAEDHLHPGAPPVHDHARLLPRVGADVLVANLAEGDAGPREGLPDEGLRGPVLPTGGDHLGLQGVDVQPLATSPAAHREEAELRDVVVLDTHELLLGRLPPDGVVHRAVRRLCRGEIGRLALERHQEGGGVRPGQGRSPPGEPLQPGLVLRHGGNALQAPEEAIKGATGAGLWEAPGDHGLRPRSKRLRLADQLLLLDLGGGANPRAELLRHAFASRRPLRNLPWSRRNLLRGLPLAPRIPCRTPWTWSPGGRRRSSRRRSCAPSWGNVRSRRPTWGWNPAAWCTWGPGRWWAAR